MFSCLSEPVELFADPQTLKRHLDSSCAAPKVFHQEFAIALAGQDDDPIGAGQPMVHLPLNPRGPFSPLPCAHCVEGLFVRFEHLLGRDQSVLRRENEPWGTACLDICPSATEPFRGVEVLSRHPSCCLSGHA